MYNDPQPSTSSTVLVRPEVGMTWTPLSPDGRRAGGRGNEAIVSTSGQADCEVVLRASEQMPLPVLAPAEGLREETMARTEALCGSVLDARKMQLPRAGERQIANLQNNN
jgi:hypothetical protein